MSGPLKGIKVLDLTQYQNGPMSTCLLSDYGATVLKLEPMGRGSPERQTFGSADGYFPLHMAFNRGKKSIQVDLKNTASRPLVEKLVAWSDVVVGKCN
jgi:formyl-CoA transferase